MIQIQGALTRWRQYRNDYLGEVIASYHPTWVQLLGGSNVEDRVEEEALAGAEAELEENGFTADRWYPRTPGQPDVDADVASQLPYHGDENEGSLPTSVLVAHYLQKVMPIPFIGV